jgi:hypothetical protein
LIAYGCAIGDRERYRSVALPAIEAVREPGDPLIEADGHDSIFGAYNEILARARTLKGLEALVLVHEDTAIAEPDFPRRLRAALADTSVAIVGVLGAIGVDGIDWWDHERLVGAARYRSVEPFPPWGKTLIGDGTVVGPGGSGEVETIDGFLMALSGWAVAELAFDESLGPGFHGYDADLCFEARRRGRRVVVVDAKADHHQRELYATGRREEWKRAYTAFRRKWDDRAPVPS